MPKVPYYMTIYFLRYTQPRYMKYLFKNIQKQQNMLKISQLFKKNTNFTVNNSRILRIQNAKFSGYCFHMKPNIQSIFQICISVPLNLTLVFQSSSVLLTYQFHPKFYTLSNQSKKASLIKKGSKRFRKQDCCVCLN